MPKLKAVQVSTNPTRAEQIWSTEELAAAKKLENEELISKIPEGRNQHFLRNTLRLHNAEDLGATVYEWVAQKRFQDAEFRALWNRLRPRDAMTSDAPRAPTNPSGRLSIREVLKPSPTMTAKMTPIAVEFASDEDPVCRVLTLMYSTYAAMAAAENTLVEAKRYHDIASQFMNAQLTLSAPQSGRVLKR